VEVTQTDFAIEMAAFGVHPPLVTIVIVNHNYRQFVDQCIQSVDEQDYSNIQCIVLDCASDDDSLSVIEAALSRAKRPIFQLIRGTTNQNHLVNSLSVLDDVKGLFVAYLDADDFLFPGFASTHVEAHLNDVNAAAVSVTDQIQVDAAGAILATTCHWHQKWRAFEPGTAWTNLTPTRGLRSELEDRMQQTKMSPLYYVPAWWSSWMRERWIWSATSGMMFRKSVIETLAPSAEQSARLRFDLGFDGYFARFAHSVGGTLVIDCAQGAYRRHGKNLWSSNPVFGGQTPSGSRDEIGRFRNSQRIARETLVTKREELLRRLGSELYYSIARQLMSTREFLAFATSHREYGYLWNMIRQRLAAGIGAID
jgi:glycosyltransferase involved in cell wall biosynthesis